MGLYGSFSSVPKCAKTGTVSAREIVRGLECVGVGKGKVNIIQIVEECVKKGLCDVYISTWSNTGAPIKQVLLPWVKVNRPRFRTCTLGVRGPSAQMQPDAVLDLQSLCGPRAVVDCVSHAAVCVAVGEGWQKTYMATEGLHEVACFGEYLIDDSFELAGAMVKWFESCPAIVVVEVPPAAPQMSLLDLIRGF